MDILQWCSDNWMVIVGISYMLDKIVKLTPTDKDDLVVDVLFGGLKKMLGKGK